MNDAGYALAVYEDTGELNIPEYVEKQEDFLRWELAFIRNLEGWKLVIIAKTKKLIKEVVELTEQIPLKQKHDFLNIVGSRVRKEINRDYLAPKTQNAYEEIKPKIAELWFNAFSDDWPTILENKLKDENEFST